MKILVCSLQVGAGASKGHLHPMLGVAERLVELGHDVTWIGVPHPLPDDDRAQVTRTGARVIAPAVGARERPAPGRLSRATLEPDRAWEVYRAFLLDPIDELVPAITAVLRAERHAVIAADGLAYAAIIAARVSGIPCATVCAGLKLAGSSSLATGYRFDLSALDEPRRAAFARHKIRARFHMLECLSEDLDLVFSTRDLVGDAIAPGVLLAGPSRTRGPRGDEPAFPWQRLDPRRPLVALAFGSVHTHELLPDVIEPFVHAARRRGAQTVVASEAHARAGTRLAGAIVVPYAPQRALLERAAAFVSHGGAGSVIESLDAGVPPIVVPLSGDQGLQARLVEARGAGVWIERAELDAARADDALDRVMRPHGALVAGARRIRAAWRDLDGALVAARALEALA